MDYWQKRNLRAQEAISKKSVKELDKQLIKYYRSTAKRVMRDFEATYDKLLATVAAGRTPTPADLYKLDKYWQMQGQLQRELQKLGDQSVKVMQEAFVKQFTGVYNSLALPGGAHYTTVSRETALQMINSVWCADGKAWSARVWTNTDLLQETLNEQLVHCVVTGKKTTELKNILQERFNVAYSNADMLVRTEVAHIQTQAAQKRYQDYGIEEVEVWVDEDERTCPICAKHEGERYKVNDRMPVPFHPRCRCCMIPVIETQI
jgi:SPP1 gp7 family putative phage head morphogenesis protein